MRTFFSNCSVFNGRSAPLDEQTVVIEGDRIVCVGREAPAPTDNDRVIDLGGRMVMPGMVIGHWHPDYPNLSFADIVHVNIGQQKPIPYLSVVAQKHLQTALLSGFTAVVGAGCAGDIDASLKLAIEEEVFDGPHIVAAGHHINTRGADNDRGHWWYNHRPQSKDGVAISGAELFADGPDALRGAVRDEIHRGVEIIKIFPVGGHGIRRPPGYQSYTNDELVAIIEATHERGARVRAHVTGAEHVLRCVRLGVDIIDHGDGLDDACIDAMVKAGTIYVPSMIFLKTLMDAPDGAMSAELLAPVREDFLSLVEMVPRVHEAGVTIVPGDDYGLNFIPHALGVYARDLLIHVEQVGIPARDVLTWATEHGAKLTQRPDTGKIAEGYVADLIVVDGDPTQDLALLVDPERNLKAIMRSGRFVKDDLGTLGSPAAERNAPEKVPIEVYAQ